MKMRIKTKCPECSKNIIINIKLERFDDKKTDKVNAKDAKKENPMDVLRKFAAPFMDDKADKVRF